jgi:glycosyltransferase involved in cell wall biosynthesis
VKQYEKLYLAEVLRDHRERLEQVATELAARGEPLGELEAELLVDAGTARLLEVENALRHDAVGDVRSYGRGVTRRLAAWWQPRIGRLYHYPPRALLLPPSYFEASAPPHALKISVVTPSYQQGRFVGRTIYSVVSQSYPSLEYVVQDGGSTDETLEVLMRFEPLLTRWRSEPDDGQADAINRAFADTTGQIMAWVNSDDLLLPGALATVARYFADHPEIDVLYGDRLMIDEYDREIGAWILPPHDDSIMPLADYVPQETLFWRRSIWEASGAQLDPSFAYALDWDLLLRFRDAGARIAHIPRLLGAFRIHEEQKTTAYSDVGEAESARLRERCHGRPVAIDEVIRRQRRYLRRHVIAHKRYRLAQRLTRRPPQVFRVADTPPIRDGVRPQLPATSVSGRD